MEWKRLGFLGLGAAILFSWGLAAGCGSDEPFEGASGGGGATLDGGAGQAGSAGQSGGAAGSTAGSSGAAGVAGAAGSAGQAGAAGDAGSAGQAGAAGEAGSAGQAGAGGGAGSADAGPDAPMCPDPLAEPNETENEATSLGSIDDCDTSGGVQPGIMAMGSDVDWYSFEGTHPLLGSCTPGGVATIDASNLRLCAFAQCSTGTTNVTCAQGSAATSPAGRQGCCSTQGAVELNHTCSGYETNATVYLRVDQPTGNACSAYQLSYHY